MRPYEGRDTGIMKEGGFLFDFLGYPGTHFVLSFFFPAPRFFCAVIVLLALRFALDGRWNQEMVWRRVDQ